MKLSDFQYDLPGDLIAQSPLADRPSSRLMVLERRDSRFEEKLFRDIKEYLAPGDCLVVNNTRVMPVRLLGKRATGGKVEIFLLDNASERPEALVKPSKRIKRGEVVFLEGGVKARVLERSKNGRFVEFDRPLEDVLEHGHVPLPPYIQREDEGADKERYQTVYASREGATAAPTAGLHFDAALLEDIEEKGVEIVEVTLHTGYGTFAPVKAEDITAHQMHSEWYELGRDSAAAINRVKSSGGRVFCVGTTSVRVLESSCVDGGVVRPFAGTTNLFIYPGYEFKIVDGLVTNFHLPGSTLLMLVSAFAGREFVLEAYEEAVRRRFRFFSYGDAMLII
ncbi:MAG: tRNA preQ1(34) S-adenosylmethionine ribosyltransferase-isomerase QueA [Candidatus Omnitrophica bacterium]|nr:tRNA preQ1(34) S-adenosylmethionine ribosyltransferase-isomerase QueA [Candidatus Omnitrophota bacterium]